MNSRFGFEIAICIFAGGGKSYPLHPSLFSSLVIGDIRPPSLTLAVAKIHAKQHLGPILGLSAACAGID